MFLFVLFFSLIIFVWSGKEARATPNIYYVSTSGDDSNPGTLSEPFRHLSKGAAAAKAGDTVIVMDGTYDNEGKIAPNSAVILTASGTSGSPITFKTQNRGKAILDSMNTAKGDTCDGAKAYINLLHSHHIVIEGFVFQRGCSEAIHSDDDAHDILIKWNEFKNIANHTAKDDIGRDGIYLNQSEYNFTFDGNIFHDIGRTNTYTNSFDHGIYSLAKNTIIVNNIFYNLLNGWAVQTASGFSGVIANNTFYGPNMFKGGTTKDGQIILWDPLGGNITIRNNIFLAPFQNAIAEYTFSTNGHSCAIDHNIVYPKGIPIGDIPGCSFSDNTTADPHFADIASRDFHVKTGSGAIDAGVRVPQVAIDFDGRARPQGKAYDIGAYELKASTPTPVTKTPAPVTKAPPMPTEKNTKNTPQFFLFISLIIILLFLLSRIKRER